VQGHLSGREHLAGAFGLADIALGCTLELSPLVGYDLGPFPALSAWIDRLKARPSWRTASTGLVRPAGAGPTRDRFVNAYDGAAPPPWDIGRAVGDLVAVFEELGISGSVLDLGCGTGENVLELARRGHEAWGIDSTPAAIAGAERKRAERGVAATFVQGDALDLGALGRTFDTVLDCGLFHVLEDDERRRYVSELDRVLGPGGRHVMLGFATTNGTGPRGYSPDDLRGFFAGGFREELIRPTSFQANGMPEPFQAWLSVFTRV
jgi:SAM-dependent methyltransferase